MLHGERCRDINILPTHKIYYSTLDIQVYTYTYTYMHIHTPTEVLQLATHDEILTTVWMRLAVVKNTSS